VNDGNYYGKCKLKIILANKFLYPRGGDCLYTLRLMKLLREAGHEVFPFSMIHPSNIETGYEKYYVSHIDFNEKLKRPSPLGALKVVARSIVNIEAARGMDRLIKDTRPDIVHLQNIHHQLTPAIIEPALRHKVPVVWTLHDYILNCPNDNFYRCGKVCSECLQGGFYHAIIHRCKKGSLGASIVAAAESYTHTPNRLAGKVAKFICPSKFMADILVKGGMPEQKVISIPNFLPPLEIEANGEDYFLFFGRLTAEKGVDTLIRAFNIWGKGRLFIAGDGPQRGEYQTLCEDANIRNVTFLGHQTQTSVHRLLAGCKAAIVPSTWWENLPYSVMETMAAGKPVIASRIGGIPEMVEHGINGLLFSAGNSADLCDMLDLIWNSPEKAHTLGKAGQAKVLSEYSPEKHYKRLMQVYDEATGSIHKEENKLENEIKQSELEIINAI
jgi:glycosyltransferase involved in cell wall biosynthesis